MKTTMAFKIDKHLLDRLKVTAKSINMNISEFVRQAILEKITKLGG